VKEFAEIESVDNGKPLAVARVADIPLAVDMFRYMGGWATKVTGSTILWSVPNEFLSYTVREPVGVVGQIIPWASRKISPYGVMTGVRVRSRVDRSILYLSSRLPESPLVSQVVA